MLLPLHSFIVPMGTLGRASQGRSQPLTHLYHCDEQICDGEMGKMESEAERWGRKSGGSHTVERGGDEDKMAVKNRRI